MFHVTGTFGVDQDSLCSHCDFGRCTGFSWSTASSVTATFTDRDLRHIAQSLVPLRTMKYGELFQCKHCLRWWHLDSDRLWIAAVPDDRHDLLDLWDRTTTHIEAAYMPILREIGATEADLYGNGLGDLKIPCATRWRDGTADDCCILLITRRPPIDDWINKVRLLEPDTVIEASEYALPQDVRRAIYAAPEVSMGFTPTAVASYRPLREFVITGLQELFRHQGVKGCDIHLSSKRPDLSNIVGSIDPRPTYVWCDWFEGCETLKIH